MFLFADQIKRESTKTDSLRFRFTKRIASRDPHPRVLRARAMSPTTGRWRKSQRASLQSVPYQGHRQAETTAQDRDRPYKLTTFS